MAKIDGKTPSYPVASREQQFKEEHSASYTELQWTFGNRFPTRDLIYTSKID
jgi:hypothetical protein